MELQLLAPPLEFEQRKEISLKIRTKRHPSEKNASSSSSCNRCSECGMSFSSTKALFGHLRIHRKSNRGVEKSSLLRLRQANHGEDVLAACILMEMRQLKSESAIDDAKLSQLRWVCAKIERERMKKTNEIVAKQSNNDEEVKNMAAVGAPEVEMHRCDKCNKTFNSGQALGGHKRAHYTGPPLCRSGRNGRLSAVAVAEEVLVNQMDLNEPAEVVFL